MEIGTIFAAGAWRRLTVAGRALLAAALLWSVSSDDARAEVVQSQTLPNGVERTTYRIGPLNITPGQNRINFRPITGASRPSVNGWITRIKPDLVYADGTVPKSSLVMFHHGVWINQSTGENFYGAGEEKTILQLPEGFGYRYSPSEQWTFNDMIHNLTPAGMTLFVSYEIDFIPETAPQADDVVRARPIWMDVESGIYPVFDVWRDSGGADGEFTYPQDAENPYPGGGQKNIKTVPANGVLLNTTGHVHTGGLSTNLYLRRPGVTYEGESCADPISYASEIEALKARDGTLVSRINTVRKRTAKLNRKIRQVKRKVRKRKAQAKRKTKRNLRKVVRRKKANLKRISNVKSTREANRRELRSTEARHHEEIDRNEACWADKPRVNDGNRVHLFNSKAEYFDPRGPVSWDMAMFSTDQDWRVRVKAGDRLELQTTYETKIASWPESMGINVVYWSRDSDINQKAGQPDPAGYPDPYVTKVDQEGVLNHGHLPENEDYGGELPVVGPDARKLPDGLAAQGPFTIGDYLYYGADFRLPGAAGRPPVIKKGEQFTFRMSDYDVQNEVWHSLTSCKAPCNRSTGISYPIPDGEFQFESGQMGPGLPPTVGITEWSTPKNLPKGTHTFFCRIHPLMRGAVRVK